MPTRSASAVWEGNLKNGKGKMKLGSGAFEGSYSFSSRFESGKGTNPEELIGAAHAGCFSMALANMLSEDGHIPKRIATTARVTIEKVGDSFKITSSDLTTEAEVPGIDSARFTEIAEKAKTGCPVSQALTGTKISLNAKLLAVATR
jgi:osmotically inducible protein OsmC